MTDEEIKKGMALRRHQLGQLMMLRRCIEADELKMRAEIFEFEQMLWSRQGQPE